jgi:hypothetical protein
LRFRPPPSNAFGFRLRHRPGASPYSRPVLGATPMLPQHAASVNQRLPAISDFRRGSYARETCYLRKGLVRPKAARAASRASSDGLLRLSATRSHLLATRSRLSAAFSRRSATLSRSSACLSRASAICSRSSAMRSRSSAIRSRSSATRWGSAVLLRRSPAGDRSLLAVVRLFADCRRRRAAADRSRAAAARASYAFRPLGCFDGAFAGLRLRAAYRPLRVELESLRQLGPATLSSGSLSLKLGAQLGESGTLAPRERSPDASLLTGRLNELSERVPAARCALPLLVPGVAEEVFHLWQPEP